MPIQPYLPFDGRCRRERAFQGFSPSITVCDTASADRMLDAPAAAIRRRSAW